MDATTFLQQQQEAQNQIDALNAQIVILNNQKNDLVNTNNTSINTAKSQCDQMVSDATAKAKGIIDTANNSAQAILDSSNKAKTDADQYVATQEAIIYNLQGTLKQSQDALALAQENFNNQLKDFNATKQDIISKAVIQANSFKIYLDDIISEINQFGNSPNA